MDHLQFTINACKKYDLQLRRSKGQNFLIDEDAYRAVVEAVELSKDDKVLEVGPGLGLLTRKLSEKAGKVTAVELDDKLAGILKTEIIAENIDNIEIVNANILDIPPDSLDYNKIAANLPYNITSVFIRKFLAGRKTESMVLMLQKEVAERIAAVPPKMSLLAVSVRLYAEVEIVRLVDRKSFWPSPEVDSAVIKIKIDPKKLENNKNINEKEFFRLVKAGFSAKRKMLKNNLAGGYQIDVSEAENFLQKSGLSAKCRAQELCVEDWLRLLTFFK